eukprot:TRINITY_DN237_c0_g1_i5.p2 TRINITY_DN237_c0_g1~~TRINITY_DN237_c0_g1_i5.p2  ORF type:complete len:139 (-),score=53.43 TRINITY_DN237_c0_g1_i5:56-472(-)
MLSPLIARKNTSRSTTALMLLDMTLKLLMFTTKAMAMVDTTSVLLRLAAMDTPPDPTCEDKKDKQCHKHPKENSRKIPKQICKKVVDTTYIEECEEIITTHCEETHEKVHHSTHVVGHDSKVVAHGHHNSYGSYGGHY